MQVIKSLKHCIISTQFVVIGVMWHHLTLLGYILTPFLAFPIKFPSCLFATCKLNKHDIYQIYFDVSLASAVEGMPYV